MISYMSPFSPFRGLACRNEAMLSLYPRCFELHFRDLRASNRLPVNKTCWGVLAIMPVSSKPEPPPACNSETWSLSLEANPSCQYHRTFASTV